MAITTLTEDVKKISLDRLQCSVVLTSDTKYHLLVVVVLIKYLYVRYCVFR